ncbi:MAG TPA: branched-chain amino acid transaminase [Nitriliruptorales bacterium]|nr:branched-chain amino acid transaminase [Nitriliruptorales bacterium]
MPIAKSDTIWMDGEFVDWDHATVHYLTPTLHYGYGVFEGIRAYATDRGPAVFQLEAHVHRMFQSARIYPPLDDIPWSEAEVCEAIKETIRRNRHDACYIRPSIFLGYGEMGLNPLPSTPRLAIATWEWGTYLGDEALEKGVRVMTSSWRRIGKNTIPPAAKANGQYINSSLAKVEAIRAGYDEAIMLTEDGYLSEGTGENIFLVRDGMLLTPPLCDGPLGGITRATVLTLASDLDIPVHETHLVRTDLYLADEAFLTGTAAEVAPVREADGRVIGVRGPVTTRIQSLYMDVVRSRVDKYKEWLAYVQE